MEAFACLIRVFFRRWNIMFIYDVIFLLILIEMKIIFISAYLMYVVVVMLLMLPFKLR